MTTSTTAHPPLRHGAEHPSGTADRALRMTAGVALVAAPLLWAAGMWTSPSASGTSDVAYITSLGRDSTMTQVSALFLHYGNLLIGLGVLASASLLRGPRGGWLVAVGSVLTALGFTNVSGMLLSDWWNLSAARTLPIETAAEVFDGVQESSLLFVWDGLEILSLVGTVLLLAGLARAGVLSAWWVAVLVAGTAGLMTIPWDLPRLSAVAVLVGFSPFAMIGVRLLQRSRLTRRV